MPLANVYIGNLNRSGWVYGTVRLLQVGALLGVFFFGSYACAQAATLSAIPAGGTSSFAVGQLFSITVAVTSSGTESLNAVSGSLSYPTDILQIVSADKTNGIINFWISEPGFSNPIGQAQFEGGVYNPGFSGSQGKVVTYLFKAKTVGTADLTFTHATILANDGQGTNILERTNPLHLTITAGAPDQQIVPESSIPPGISVRSATHPDQHAWYSSSMVAIAWDVPPGVTAVRTGIDHNRQSIPTTIAGSVISEMTLNLEDGTWYFHIQTKDAKGWGSVSSFKINIDTSAVNPPTFDTFPTVLTEGDVLLVSGSAPKNAVIRMSLKNSGGDVLEQSAKAGDDGRFQAVWNAKLNNDSYTLSAEAVNSRGLKSSRSQDVVVTVNPTVIERVAKPVIDYATIFVLVAGIVVLCVLWVWYLVQRARHFRKKVRADIKRTNQLIHVQFKKLLDQARSRRKLTAEEERMMSIIREGVQDIEEEVEDEVRDIGQ